MHHQPGRYTCTVTLHEDIPQSILKTWKDGVADKWQRPNKMYGNGRNWCAYNRSYANGEVVPCYASFFMDAEPPVFATNLLFGPPYAPLFLQVVIAATTNTKSNSDSLYIASYGCGEKEAYHLGYFHRPVRDESGIPDLFEVSEHLNVNVGCSMITLAKYDHNLVPWEAWDAVILEQIAENIRYLFDQNLTPAFARILRLAHDAGLRASLFSQVNRDRCQAENMLRDSWKLSPSLLDEPLIIKPVFVSARPNVLERLGIHGIYELYRVKTPVPKIMDCDQHPAIEQSTHVKVKLHQPEPQLSTASSVAPSKPAARRSQPKTWRALASVPSSELHTVFQAWEEWNFHLSHYSFQYRKAFRAGRGKTLAMVDTRHQKEHGVLYLLGFMHCFHGGAKRQRYLDIAGLFTHPQCLRRGIAEYLVEAETCRLAAEHDFYAYLHAPHDAFEIFGLAKKLGFEKIEGEHKRVSNFNLFNDSLDNDSLDWKLFRRDVLQGYRALYDTSLHVITSFPGKLSTILPEDFLEN